MEALAAILAALDVNLREFFKPFKEVVDTEATGPSTRERETAREAKQPPTND